MRLYWAVEQPGLAIGVLGIDISELNQTYMTRVGFPFSPSVTDELLPFFFTFGADIQFFS
jgi:hypothetical protein